MIVDTPQERKRYENFILNNRIDNPKYGLRIDALTRNYEDPRLAVGWTCWLASANQQRKE